MNWNKIFALSLRHIYLIKAPFKNFRLNLVTKYTNISLGFISKFFTLNSSYYENTVGIILSAAILRFLFRSSISYNMCFWKKYGVGILLIYL